MADYLVMLSALSAVSVYTYRGKALLLIAVSALTCVLCRRAANVILRTAGPSADLSSLVTGISLALLLPVTAPWWMAVCGGVFAVLVCSVPFGRADKTPFVPAAAAVSFLSLCWQDRMFLYPDTDLPSYFGVLEAGTSLTSMLSRNHSIGRNPAAFLSIITGNVPSPIGAGCVIALAGALLYLIIRRPKSCVAALSFLLSASLMALLFPRTATGRLSSLIMELCGGMLLFSAVFFMTYPSVMPERLSVRALWGFAGGIICMLARYFGTMEESVCFGIVITDALSEIFSNIPLTKREKKAIYDAEPYTEIVPATFVPEKILNEIPDIPEEDNAQMKQAAEADETAETKSLDSVISEENTASDGEAPFITGGDGDE